MSCERNKKRMNEGSVNVKAIVAAVVALIVVVVIIVVATGNSDTSELNKLIKNGDIDEAANYYLDKFEETGEEISDKTLELLKDGIAKIEKDYTAGNITADEAYEKLVAYRPFRDVGIEEEYSALYALIGYNASIAEGDSYDEYLVYGDDTYYYNFSDVYLAYFTAYELAEGYDSLDESVAAAGLQKIKDYMVDLAETYEEAEDYKSAYFCIQEMTLTEYYENDEDITEYFNELYELWMEQEEEE